MSYQRYNRGIGLRIQLRISTGFFMIVLLMLALAFVGLKHMAQVNAQIKNIVENNNVKIELGQIMQHALHERALSMHSIAVLKDAFLQDEEFIRFNAMGSRYLNARKNLEALNLTGEEKEILSNIRALTKETQPYVQEVVRIGLDTRNPIIFDKIRELAIPKQRLIAEQVNKLVALQKEQALAALNNEQSSYKNARNLMLLLGSLATILGVIIATLVIRHVTKLAKKLEYQALHDELTGLPNRLLFKDRVKSSLLRGQRQSISFSVILIDLDRFKAVNDSLGHNVGDLLLQEVARRLINSVRKVDTVARLGGDEFVIILESLNHDETIHFADKLVSSISKPFLLAGHDIDVGVSMGIASYPEQGQDCSTLINRADIAMYEAKKNNKAYACYINKMKKHNLNVVRI
jgi:diguanylate cyclase (GGDEF)-like protein